MNNEIIRKLTSLTLLSILLVSGVTFGVPGAIPVAEASHNANLFVSAENSQFNNYFAGPQVIEVVINDNDIKTLDDVHGEPDVTVNGKKLRMAQATDGNWYGYFASKASAQAADATQPNTLAGNKGLDFGEFCAETTTTAGINLFTQSKGFAVAHNGAGSGVNGTATIVDCTTAPSTTTTSLLNHVVRENKTLNISAGPLGQIGISSGAWPVVQLYDFSTGGNVIVKYNKGGGSQTTTLTFDTIPSNLIKAALDRSTYPQGAAVHITVTDPQLNIDPTDEDSWTWDTSAANNRVFYQAFDENGAADANGGAGMQNIIGNLTTSTFMFEKNGKLTVNPAAQGSTVAAFGDNDDQVFPPTDASAVTFATGMTFVESDPKSGIFGNYDESDNSNLDITAIAERGKSATVRYNDVSASIVVGFGFGTLDIALPSGNTEWNSGEEIPVTLVDSDANKNSRADEDLDLNDPNVALIPTLKIGTPFTLKQGDTVRFFNVFTDTGAGKNGTITVATPHGVVTGTIPTPTVQQFSQRELIVPTGLTTNSTFTFPAGGALVIDLNRNFGDLKASIKDTQGTTGATRYHGFNFFNYDVRALSNNATVPVTNMEILLAIQRGAPIALDATSLSLTTANTISLANVTSSHGLINLNSTASLVSGIFAVNNSANDPIALIFKNTGTASALDNQTKPVVADFFSFGQVGDGLKPTDRINNAIYRFELEETGDNTSTFVGTAEFTMLNQLNILDVSTYTGLQTIDDEVTFIVHEDLDDEDSPRINYFDKGADGVDTQIADQQAAGTHSGAVAFDKESYKTADTVTVTLTDADLNVDSETIDIYVTVSTTTDSAIDAVGEAGLPLLSNGDALGRLADITFDDNRWQFRTAACVTALTTAGVGDTSLSDAGFTLVETGIDTGVFKGDFQIPAKYCDPSGVAVSTNGLDLEVNYVDFRDASGQTIETGDGAGVRANTGSVSLDRTVYPVPFGELGDFAAITSGKAPNNRSVFPIHATGIDAPLTDPAQTLGDGALTIHVRVNDPDFDVSATGEDKIPQDKAGFTVGPVKVIVSRGADKVVLAYAGGDAVNSTGRIDVGDNNVDSANNTRDLGPITEIAPDAGIFEFDLPILYTDGPASAKCPATTGFHPLDGTTALGASTVRFDSAAGTGTNYCILQGDIITVEYTDPSDSSGNPTTVTDSATFDLRNGVLQSDKSVYIIGADMIMTLIEPDLDLDSQEAETWDLDLIEWDSDADTTTMGDQATSAANTAAFDPEPADFRETGDNTGIFQIVIEIPNTLAGAKLDRGEEIQLEYTDWGPSGADFVGDENEDINLTIYTSNFGATVELDQKVYTWTDKVFITIVAPDHNFDSNLIDQIGETADDEVRVATRGHKLPNYKLTETGTDTGIFTGEVILTGFAFDADGDRTTGDADGFDTNPVTGTSTGATATGPTDGFLESDDDDGLTVSFEFTEDETVVGSALIRWNIGEVQFLEASYPATGQGVVRVVDPDMNLNPEAVDNFDIDAWSDSDAGGIDLTVSETNEATGIFEGTVFFTVTDQSSGHRLRVAEGDTVTAEYSDNTLPSPYTTADELEIDATTFIGSIVPPLERAPASNPRIVDAFGNELNEVNVDQQVQITADLANGQDRDQPFAYLVQIQDSDGVTVSLSWITGSLAPGQSLNPAQSWTPTASGTYNVQIFVWESVDNPDALSPPVSTTITVV